MSRIFTGSPAPIGYHIKLFLVQECSRQGYPAGRGTPPAAGSDEKLRHPKSGCRSRFPATKTTTARTCRRGEGHRLSSSPDWRFTGTAQPSQVSPMTDFRPMQSLRVYSGGTVRDLHTIIYSPTDAVTAPGALKRIFTCLYHTTLEEKCQWVACTFYQNVI